MSGRSTFALALASSRLGLVDVVGVALHVLGHAPQVVRDRHRVALDGAAQDLLVEAVVVEGVADGAAHVDVVHRRPLVVDLEHHDAHRLLLDDLDVRRLAQALDLVVGQVAAGALVVALDHAEHARVVLLHMPELDLVDVLGAPRQEVAGEALGDEADGGIVAASACRSRSRRRCWSATPRPSRRPSRAS